MGRKALAGRCFEEGLDLLISDLPRSIPNCFNTFQLPNRAAQNRSELNRFFAFRWLLLGFFFY